MLAVPVFLSLFLMGILLAAGDRQQVLRYTSLPEGHWLLAIILFVIVGASLPWQEFTWLTGLQALGLLVVRAAAKSAALAWSGGSLPCPSACWSASASSRCRPPPSSWLTKSPPSTRKSAARRWPCRCSPPPSWNWPAPPCARWRCAVPASARRQRHKQEVSHDAGDRRIQAQRTADARRRTGTATGFPRDFNLVRGATT